MKRYYWVAILLFLAVFFEVRAQSHWIYTEDKAGASIIYIVCGLLVGIMPLIKLPYRPQSSFFTPIHLKPYIVLVKLVIWGVFVFFAIQACLKIFSKYEIDYYQADMLPVIEIMSSRFLAGEEVYAFIPEIWNGMEPVYLPTMWLPFVPSVAWNFDMRWTTLAFILGGCLLVSLHPTRSKWKEQSIESLLAFVPLALLFFDDLFIVHRAVVMGLSEEGVVFGFHLLLVFALIWRRTVPLAIALSCCVLSRYVIVIWATMYIMHLFFAKRSKLALQVMAIGIGLSTFLMWMTGAFSQLAIFVGLQGEYVDLLEVKRWDYEEQINKALGLAKFFAYEDLIIMHRWFLFTAFVVPFLCLGIVQVFKKWINMSFFALCSLKITLVFFYNLLIIPYEYLFYTSTFVSIGIMFYYLNPQLHPKTESVS